MSLMTKGPHAGKYTTRSRCKCRHTYKNHNNGDSCNKCNCEKFKYNPFNTQPQTQTKPETLTDKLSSLRSMPERNLKQNKTMEGAENHNQNEIRSAKAGHPDSSDQEVSNRDKNTLDPAESSSPDKEQETESEEQKYTPTDSRPGFSNDPQVNGLGSSQKNPDVCQVSTVDTSLSQIKSELQKEIDEEDFLWEDFLKEQEIELNCFGKEHRGYNCDGLRMAMSTSFLKKEYFIWCIVKKKELKAKLQGIILAEDVLRKEFKKLINDELTNIDEFRKLADKNIDSLIVTFMNVWEDELKSKFVKVFGQ